MPLSIFCMKTPIEIHANGKLLITGEYLVLVGAKALALPVRFGQSLHVEEIKKKIIDWESTSLGETWFTGEFNPESLDVISTDKPVISSGLKKLLSAARKLNPEFLTDETGYKVSIHANYQLSWGLGSSSTLCFIIAKWARVDAYDLFRLISPGSGYDIACAGQQDLLYYQLIEGHPIITPTRAGKALRDNTYFVYLGKKQDSRKEVKAFSTNSNYTDKEVEQVSRLASFICQAESASELIHLVDEHEAILCSILKRKPITRQFSNFPGTVKSLGAWGGDFAMFVSEESPETITNILQKNGFSTVFTFTEIEATK
jgi:mevalonate kinase